MTYIDLNAVIAERGNPDLLPHRMSGVRVLILIGMALALAVAWIHEALS